MEPAGLCPNTFCPRHVGSCPHMQAQARVSEAENTSGRGGPSTLLGAGRARPKSSSIEAKCQRGVPPDSRRPCLNWNREGSCKGLWLRTGPFSASGSPGLAVCLSGLGGCCRIFIAYYLILGDLPCCCRIEVEVEFYQNDSHVSWRIRPFHDCQRTFVRHGCAEIMLVLAKRASGYVSV